MCGVVGYIGSEDCASVILDGLKKLEYRGYDSAGMAISDVSGELKVIRAEGKLSNLEKIFYQDPFSGTRGLGHIRWATHGAPTEVNAHPHVAGRIVLAHNGIIENYMELRDHLLETGREFFSATDTEVIAHLIDSELKKNEKGLHAAVLSALAQVDGSYAFVVMDIEDPETMVVARNAAPMVLGRNENGAFAASDIPAVLEHTRKFVFLDDGDTAILTREKTMIFDASGTEVDRPEKLIQWDPISAEKQGYKHFMLKEIFEQPTRIIDTLRGRADVTTGNINLNEVDIEQEFLESIQKIIIVACGTSYYSAMVGRYLIEQNARISVDVDLASEFRYRDPIINENTLCIAISQSGETADTLAALREAKKRGAKTMAICNVIESTIARESDGVLYTHAGPEIAVASTKASTTQLVAVSMLAIFLGRHRGTLSADQGREWIEALRAAPTAIETMLNNLAPYDKIAKKFSHVNSFLYLGRGQQYPVALEGALKLKEISYIHAEGYASGEMKHGPIALIDENMPIVAIAPADSVYEKTISNVQEAKARQGKIIGIVTEGDNHLSRISDYVIEIPKVDVRVQPLLTYVAVQLISYHIADFKGTDIDQPRNLAKSVTVE